MTRIYLPDGIDSLKECDVKFDYQKVLKFINNKSIEMGGKCKPYHEYLFTPYKLKEGERLSKEKVWVDAIETHDFWNGMSENSGYKEVSEIYYNEQPIIKTLYNIASTEKDYLKYFLNEKVLWKYVTKHEYNRSLEFEEFINNYGYYRDMNNILSFKNLNVNSCIKYKNLIAEFLGFFTLENERTFPYELIENFFNEEFQYEPYRSMFLKASRKKYDEANKIAKKNEKILSLTLK
ncbi:MAG: hypothetical protein IJO32_07320 [Bacilli bacterium]|nr:hypothetical protein [Bacilli bacterium]